MTQRTQPRIWFITGASTGFGRILAEELLKAGNKVIATARKVEQVADLEQEYPNSAKALPLDVTDASQVISTVAAAISRFGHVDVVVNSAGYGVTDAVGEASVEERKPVFESNVFGLARVTQAFLPHLRERRSGHILNISSIGGLLGLPAWGFYDATKFAVEGLSEALAAEINPLGIRVTIVEPGPFRTDFLGRSGTVAETRIADYDQTEDATRAYRGKQEGMQPGDPVRAVHAMMQVVDAPNPPLHLLLRCVGDQPFPRQTRRLAEKDYCLGAGHARRRLSEGRVNHLRRHRAPGCAPNRAGLQTDLRFQSPEPHFAALAHLGNLHLRQQRKDH